MHIDRFTRGITLLFSFLLLSSCTEIPPKINPVFTQGKCPPADETTVAQQKRGVLIEEFSGVRCANCPAGSAAIRDLLRQYGDQLVAVSIHTGFFAQPYQDNRYDFRTPAGDDLLKLLQSPLGFPSAVINRKLFDGEPDLQLGLANWAGYVAREVQDAPAVKILALPIFDEPSRKLSVDVSIFPQTTFTGEDVRLSVMLTENQVVDVQLTPSGKDLAFEHNHVLRTMLTNADGNLLPNELKAGQSDCLFFETDLQTDWRAEQCYLVAFVHRGGESKDVLQAVQVKILP